MGEKVFVDANIFLEIFLKDSKSEECKDFLKSLKDENKTAFTTDFLSYICILVIQNNLKESKFIRDAIIFFLRVSVSKEEMLLLLLMWQKIVLGVLVQPRVGVVK